MVKMEHLAYFKSLFEGRAAISWNAWFKLHEHELSQLLSRVDFLRLKFEKLDEAEKLLNNAGISFTKSPQARREKYYSFLHDSVLDETGRPSEAFRRKAYGGAMGLLRDGDVKNGKAKLLTYVKKALRRPIQEKIEQIQDLCYEGTLEFECGDKQAGIAILQVIADLESGDDLIDPAIFLARETLEKQ